MMSVWAGVGFSMVIYLAGLQAIPEELYEAARVDGAGAGRRLRYITIPMLRPTTLFLLVIGIIGSFQVFTQIFIMTSGGPVEQDDDDGLLTSTWRPSSSTRWATPAPWPSRCSPCCWSSPSFQLRLYRKADA